MNDKPRNRFRPTKAESVAEREAAAKQLNALGARLMVAYCGIVVAFMAGLLVGAAFL